MVAVYYIEPFGDREPLVARGLMAMDGPRDVRRGGC